MAELDMIRKFQNGGGCELGMKHSEVALRESFGFGGSWGGCAFHHFMHVTGFNFVILLHEALDRQSAFCEK